MVLYNSDAAAKSTFFLSVLLGVLMAFNILPEIPLSFLICYLNFIIILIFWQDIKEIFMKPQLLFVDKLSIPQDDEKLKQDCIMGLGGYLRSSRNLVILWSEGYFRRLWCVFELNVFLRRQGVDQSVEVMPVVVPSLILLHTVWWFVIYSLFEILWETWTQTLSRAVRFGVTVIFFVLAFSVVFTLQSRVGEQLVAYLKSLPSQLQKFDIHHAECSCCSFNHLHPKTGEHIPCDRELICETVTQAYGNRGDSEEERLKAFNSTVRNKLANRILASWGSKVMPLRLYVNMVFSVPISFLAPRISGMSRRMPEAPSTAEAMLVVVNELLFWAASFPVLLFYLWGCMRIWKHKKHESYPILRKSCQGLGLVLQTFFCWLFQLWPFGFFSFTPAILVVVLPISTSTALALYLLKKAEITVQSEEPESTASDVGTISPSFPLQEMEASTLEDPMVEVCF